MRAKKTDCTDLTHEAFSRPDFRERLAALIGPATGWREPGGSRATGNDHMPIAHKVAATMAYARRMVPGAGGEMVPDPSDIGPDIAVACLCGSDYRRGHIVRAVTWAMRADRSRVVHRNQDAIGYIVNAAFDRLVHQRTRPKLRAMRQTDWDELLLAAMAVLASLAEDSVTLAARRWKAKA